MHIFYVSRLWAGIWGYILAIYLTLPVMRSILDFLKDNLGGDTMGMLLNAALILAAAGLAGAGARRGIESLAQIVLCLAIMGWAVYQLDIPEERVHFLQYGLLGILVFMTRRSGSWWELGALAGFVVLVGIGDELIQWWLPNRVGDLRDVAMNAGAGVLGLWIGRSLFPRARPVSD